MIQDALTKHEKLVLFALTEDATRTDAAVAERVGMRESTAGENRRKLLSRGYLVFSNVPAYHKLGFEFAADIHMYSNPSLKKQVPVSAYGAFFANYPRIFDAFTGDGYLGCLGIFESYTVLSKFLDDLSLFLTRNDVRPVNLSHSVFPFETTRCTLEYNYAPSLNRIWTLDQSEVAPASFGIRKPEKVELTPREARLFSELISFPTKSDRDMAATFKRSRASITEMRNRLMKKGLYTRLAMPSINSLAFDRLMQVYLRFDRPVSFKEKASIAGPDWWHQAIAILEKSYEIIASYPLKDLQDSHYILSNYIQPFYSAGVLTEEPKIYVHRCGTTVDFTETHHSAIIDETRKLWISHARPVKKST
ncbi:MAG: AsnC family transcriptional regulator [Thermoplasmata archaeon]|nr:AsnC family transcriptional regulator [Thermoplasmata archaeon]